MIMGLLNWFSSLKFVFMYKLCVYMYKIFVVCVNIGFVVFLVCIELSLIWMKYIIVEENIVKRY